VQTKRGLAPNPFSPIPPKKVVVRCLSSFCSSANEILRCAQNDVSADFAVLPPLSGSLVTTLVSAIMAGSAFAPFRVLFGVNDTVESSDLTVSTQDPLPKAPYRQLTA
jgi:hypothetical protein